MVGCLRESKFIAITLFISFNSASAMVSMKMCNKHISNVIRFVSPVSQSFNKPLSSMQVNMTEKFLILLIPPSCINENNMASCFNNKRPECKNYEIIFI